jgi:hypothetical protein
MKYQPLLKLLAAAGALALATVARADDTPNPKEVTRKGSYTTSLGGSGTATSTTARGSGVVNRQGNWTNAAGGAGKWQSQTVWNKGTNTATVNGSATRPNGNTSTWQGTAVRTAPGVIAGKGTITLANGKQVTYASTDTRVAPGSWDKQEVITTPNGKTIDRTIDTSVADGNGTRTATTTLPDGKTVTTNGTFTQTVSTQSGSSPTP